MGGSGLRSCSRKITASRIEGPLPTTQTLHLEVDSRLQQVDDPGGVLQDKLVAVKCTADHLELHVRGVTAELVMISACRVERPEEFDQRVVRLQAEFAAGDAATRRRLLQPAHAKERFENYDPDAPSLSDADARLLIANQEGYAYWGKGAGRVGKNPFFGRPTGKPNLSAPMLTKAER
jgi:hypothetical protein